MGWTNSFSSLVNIDIPTSCIDTENDTAENRLKETFFVVRATDHEVFSFWQDYAENSPVRRALLPPSRYQVQYPVFSWEQLNGWAIHVEDFGGMPCYISMTWVRIAGRLIAFYHGCSMVRHYDMEEKWVSDHFKGRYESGSRYAWCDSSRFHHCVGAIEDANRTSL